MSVRSHGIPHSIVSDQGILFTAEVWQWAHAHGIRLYYQAPHHPEASAFIAWWNGF